MNENAIKSALILFRDSAKDWECMKIPSMPDVSIQKVPATKNRGIKLQVLINPVDNTGRTLKYKGYGFTELKLFDRLKEAMNLSTVIDLMGIVDKLNPKAEDAKPPKELKI